MKCSVNMGKQGEKNLYIRLRREAATAASRSEFMLLVCEPDGSEFGAGNEIA